jgi:hypothetical protein
MKFIIYTDIIVPNIIRACAGLRDRVAGYYIDIINCTSLYNHRKYLKRRHYMYCMCLVQKYPL